MFSINPDISNRLDIMMKAKDPHWTFYAEILSRSLKDLETACTATPDSSDFEYFRKESPEIVAEARDALTALEGLLRNYDQAMATPASPPTHH